MDQFTAAKEAFSLALCMVFKTEHTPLCSLLADIYTNLGLLYEQQYTQYAVQKTFDNFPQHAALYFDLACLFTAHEIDESSEATTTLEPLFELIYHAVDPYLPPFSYDASCNLIDALIYVYICVINKILPNQAIGSELNKPGMLDTFAQHIHWLIMEAYYKKQWMS